MSMHGGRPLRLSLSRWKAFFASVEAPSKVTLWPRFERGDPFNTISMIAAEGYDLLVIGTHGWSERWHIRMGEVAERLVAQPPCTILTVHASDPRTEADEVVPWFPRDRDHTHFTETLFEPSKQPALSQLHVPCPETGATRDVLHCLQCEKYVAGCVAPSAGSFDMVCRKNQR